MNLILIAGIFLVLVLLIGFAITKLMKRYPEKQKILKSKLKILLFRAIHNTANNASLPIIYNSLVQIDYILHQNESMVSCIP